MAETTLTRRITIWSQRSLMTGLLGFLVSGLLSAGIAVAETRTDLYDAVRLMDATPTHQIPLLGDRFRIDDHIDEITMVFFRNPNSRPVVLILPDGSKWYSTRHPRQVRWETGPGFDQVTIENPMRGPWQVSGDLRADSRLLVMSDLQFNAEPLPRRVYQGERLPIAGAFTEAGRPIEQRDFRSAIELALYLVSTNEEQYENFGLNPRQVGSFKDDGKDLDARARDGQFTGSVAFDVPTGAYIPSYRAVTPLYQRNYEQTPIYVTELPLQVEIEQGSGEKPEHQIRFVADEYYLDPNDIIIRGEVVFPNGERQLFDRSTARGDTLLESITSASYGIFTVRATLYATTREAGREIVAQLQDVDFMVRPPQQNTVARLNAATVPSAAATLDVVSETVAASRVAAATEGDTSTAASVVPLRAQPTDSIQLSSPWILAIIVATNLCLVLIWFIIMWRRRR